MMLRSLLLVALLLALPWVALPVATESFDHGYSDYAQLLARHVDGARVTYAALKADRGALDRVAAQFDAQDAQVEGGWTREQRMAFWINAYNTFTLRAIVDAYPIQSRWFTRQPRNSIRQIPDVWTSQQWRGAGRAVSLDDIEHRVLRPVFKDARVHFAVNCASLSCPPLAAEPYRADTLDAQLDAAAGRYLASPEGLRLDGNTLLVSSIFKWYGEDFVAEYSSIVPGTRPPVERAILGAIVKYGPPDAAVRARNGGPEIAFLDYDWSLNETEPR
ncbi:MAG: DUF547 domain-containing protein [Planctomycetota bacterium]|nr:DUF547 domain-containing protein [Planctomycetota bacterium]